MLGRMGAVKRSPRLSAAPLDSWREIPFPPGTADEGESTGLALLRSDHAPLGNTAGRRQLGSNRAPSGVPPKTSHSPSTKILPLTYLLI